MHRTPTRSTLARLASMSIVAGVFVAQAGAAGASSPPRTAAVVRPGGSIQRAIDQTPAGGTVRISPGTYPENLLITKTINLVGDRVTLTAPPNARPNACSSTSPEDRLPGICVLGDLTIAGPETTPTVNTYVDDVRITGIRVTGFPGSGVFAYGANRLAVAGDELDHNGLNGAISLASHGTTYSGNNVHDNGLFGLTVEDSPGAAALIVANRVTANNGIGVLVRDSDGATVTANIVTGNCAGVMALRTHAGVPTSGLDVTANRVTANNRFCPANADGYPAMAGLGIGLFGATDSTVRFNVVTGQRADQRSDLPAGGILLVDTTPFGGGAPDGNVVTHNLARDNQIADLVSDGTGNNTMVANSCGTSQPDGAC